MKAQTADNKPRKDGAFPCIQKRQNVLYRSVPKQGEKKNQDDPIRPSSTAAIAHLVAEFHNQFHIPRKQLKRRGTQRSLAEGRNEKAKKATQINRIRWGRWGRRQSPQQLPGLCCRGHVHRPCVFDEHTCGPGTPSAPTTAVPSSRNNNKPPLLPAAPGAGC